MQSLDSLRTDSLTCRTSSLCETRTKVVFGSGNPSADLMFVGEAPGKSEDEQGKPFVGAAGKFLKRELQQRLAKGELTAQTRTK